ncbi:MAG: ABC transporter ATP-binding protein [Nitrososphaerota archaeon]|jgi:peptide/nickel transport system ATP-binding protein|nr:ABC transporter ATP-binding protein [Nitrososphaerota archaeon]MDG6959853.1 ABC transporter ATP-binding protein [Nitrososphaerota archaeon]MDG6961940.1 ABC transporter ATP-binding protein [Nitrososphaerota archaeon]MDG6965835.1 ABC transporter ATP-binding protein [Nitrososphaerota archaeon]MDG6972916.1 ABC transporter ATP-binding protein [Nitrososphaerota archaeon]
MTQPVARFEDLVITYPSARGSLKAVDGVTLEVVKGEFLGLVGESGCGKTTLALTLLRMNEPGKVTGGSVKVEGIDLLSLDADALRRFRWEKVAMVFQAAMNTLDPVKTVESQIVETIVQHSQETKEQARAKVQGLLELVSIDPARAKSYPHELSGGMRQRVVIALALCLSPDILIADEPTTALDVVVQAGVMRTLKALQAKLGVTTILITHDISIMNGTADRLAIMYAGKIVEVGPTQQVIADPQHPYTQALLGAVPAIGSGTTVVKGIPGSPPDLISPPAGCRFAPRCPYAFDRCTKEEPPLVGDGKDMVACWLRTK